APWDPTWVSLFAGVSAIATGTATSGPTVVVKCVTLGTTGFPARSDTPLTVTVICVFAGNGSCSTSTTSCSLLLKNTVSGTATCVPLAICTVAAFTVIGLIGTLNRNRTFAFTAMLVVPFGGATSTTCGPV